MTRMCDSFIVRRTTRYATLQHVLVLAHNKSRVDETTYLTPERAVRSRDNRVVYVLIVFLYARDDLRLPVNERVLEITENAYSRKKLLYCACERDYLGQLR